MFNDKKHFHADDNHFIQSVCFIHPSSIDIVLLLYLYNTMHLTTTALNKTPISNVVQGII